MWQNSKTQTVKKLKYWIFEKSKKKSNWQNPKLWQLQNWTFFKTQNWSCDKNWKLKLWRKKLNNSSCDKILKLKNQQNWKTQIVTKLKISNLVKTELATILKNWNCDKTQNSKCDIILFLNSNCDKTLKLKQWPNLKTQILTKLNNSNSVYTQF